MQNHYDNDTFFEKYSGMSRSKQGLAGAGEWKELEKLLPDFAGKRVLDLGCGFGWHCIYAAEHGAQQVIGVDLSRKMLDRARAQTEGQYPQVEYRCGSMEDIDFPAESFDVVLSSLAFHYLPDFTPLSEKIAACLKPGGEFIFSVEHPVFTAAGPQQWHLDSGGNPLHWPVDRYFQEGERNAVFLDEPVTKYHRTLTTYLTALLRCGFTLRAVVEPEPPAEMMHLPGMADELRRPMMLLVSAQK